MNNELGFLQTLGSMPVYIARSKEPRPSDQTNLNERLILILKGGGRWIHETQPDWLRGEDGHPRGQGARLVSMAGGPPLWWPFFSCLLEFSCVCVGVYLYVNLTCGPPLDIF
jgi:hypothetical protein